MLLWKRGGDFKKNYHVTKNGHNLTKINNLPNSLIFIYFKTLIKCQKYAKF